MQLGVGTESTLVVGRRLAWPKNFTDRQTESDEYEQIAHEKKNDKPEGAPKIHGKEREMKSKTCFGCSNRRHES